VREAARKLKAAVYVLQSGSPKSSTKRVALVYLVASQSVTRTEPPDSRQGFLLEPLAPLPLGV